MMDEIITEKLCGRCNEIKPITDFYKDSGHKYGVQTYCKKCMNLIHHEYVVKNPEKIREHFRKWQLTHVEQEHNKRVIKWRSCPQELKEKNKTYRRENKEKANQYQKKYISKHPEKVVIRANNRRARKLNNGGVVLKGEWLEVLEKYEYTCLCCGRTDVKLTMDHVKPLVLGGCHSIENLQPLCKPCNSRKHTQIIDYRPCREK